MFPGEMLEGTIPTHPSKDEMMSFINTAFSLHQFSDIDVVEVDMDVEDTGRYNIKVRIEITEL